MERSPLKSQRSAPLLYDPVLPQLERALDPEAVEPRLRRCLGEHGRPAVRVLKHTPGKRCVLAYLFADGTRAVGKLYRKQRAEQHAVVLAEVSQALAGGTRAPRLLDCWEDLGLLLEEWAPGAMVPDYEHLGGQGALVERLGAALAELHEAPVRGGPAADLAALVRRACHPGLEALATAIPELAAPLGELAAAMYESERRLAGAVRPCHGDFSPRQVFVGPPLVWLVDLDGLCQGDPALDVASFRVGLEVHLGAEGRLLGDRFLAAYLERRGLDRLPTLPHHEVFCDLRRAMILWRKRPPNWEADLQSSLDRGRARL